MNTLGLLRHVISSQQFDRPLLERIFDCARQMEVVVAAGGDERLRGRVMATLFYEPSTRTRLSFEAAMLRLGGRVIGTENAAEFSSVAKGETLEDTIRIVSGYADLIVLRHQEPGASDRAAAVSTVPVINGGDGPGQHPTQALLDLYTIEKECGRIDGITIAMVGDLANGRTVRSLAYLLSKYRDVTFHFVAPPALRMKDDIKEHLAECGATFHEHTSLADALPLADVVYQTRVQKERFASAADYERVHGVYVFGTDEMRLLRPDAVLLHPLPRVGEIEPEVDADPRAGYFRQARNGVFIRMALLDLLLGRGN
ncbi:MAG: aspartate carbamoyltransferase [Candidatus Dormibacteria bacterium]